MPKLKSVTFQGYDGSQKEYESISQACRSLGLNVNTVSSKLYRTSVKDKASTGAVREYYWTLGKLYLNENTESEA